MKKTRPWWYKVVGGKGPIFVILFEDHAYRIYANGKIEGFPKGCQVINYISTTMDYLNAKIKHQAKLLAGLGYKEKK